MMDEAWSPARVMNGRLDLSVPSGNGDAVPHQQARAFHASTEPTSLRPPRSLPLTSSLLAAHAQLRPRVRGDGLPPRRSGAAVRYRAVAAAGHTAEMRRGGEGRRGKGKERG